MAYIEQIHYHFDNIVFQDRIQDDFLQFCLDKNIMLLYDYTIGKTIFFRGTKENKELFMNRFSFLYEFDEQDYNNQFIQD